MDETRIKNSVAQSAPVLGNLRNLALAEFRANNDSLTGLPNKRASDDEELLVLLPETTAQNALALTERIRDTVASIRVPGVDRAITSASASLTSSGTGAMHRDCSGRPTGRSTQLRRPAATGWSSPVPTSRRPRSRSTVIGPA
jgi:GGDEF domain-containing protein